MVILNPQKIKQNKQTDRHTTIETLNTYSMSITFMDIPVQKFESLRKMMILTTVQTDQARTHQKRKQKKQIQGSQTPSTTCASRPATSPGSCRSWECDDTRGVYNTQSVTTDDWCNKVAEHHQFIYHRWTYRHSHSCWPVLREKILGKSWTHPKSPHHQPS